MQAKEFDPNEAYFCRICKGPLPAGTITPANFPWFQAHGTDCSDECHGKRVERMTHLKEQNSRRAKDAEYFAMAQARPADDTQPHDALGRRETPWAGQ